MALSDRYEPYAEALMDTENPKFTICEVIREIYKLSTDPEVKMRARIAMTMAKKMQMKLIKYNALEDNYYKGQKTGDMREKIKNEILFGREVEK